MCVHFSNLLSKKKRTRKKDKKFNNQCRYRFVGDVSEITEAFYVDYSLLAIISLPFVLPCYKFRFFCDLNNEKVLICNTFTVFIPSIKQPFIIWYLYMYNALFLFLCLLVNNFFRNFINQC